VTIEQCNTLLQGDEPLSAVGDDCYQVADGPLHIGVTAFQEYITWDPISGKN
jgi:hypothetical protein